MDGRGYNYLIMDDVQEPENEATNELPEKEETVKSTRKSRSAKVEVRVVTPILQILDGVDHACVVTREGYAYFVPCTEIVMNFKTWQEVGASLLVDEVYQWSDELTGLLTDIEFVRKNVFLSFLRAGAFSRDAASKPEVRRNMFNSAFPYRL